MTIELPMRLEGYPMVQRLNSAGEVVETIGPYRNTLTYGMYSDILGTGENISNIPAFGKVGTGTAPILVSDSALPGHAASVTRGANAPVWSIQNSVAPYYAELTQQFDFPQGALVGTFGCVGVGPNSGASISAGSQIKDTEGNPTTITLTADEQLRLTYRIRAYAPPATSSGTIVVNGTPHNGTIYAGNFTAATMDGYGAHRALRVANLPNAYEPPATVFSSMPFQTGSTYVNASVTAASYTHGANYRDFGCVIPAVEANFPAGINCIRYSTVSFLGLSVVYDFVLDTPIMKTNLQQLSLQWRSVLGVGPV